MKNILLILSLTLAATSSFAVSLYLNTHGEERYADGTPAMEGECVALVWQRNGTTFPGFTADGEFVGGEDLNTFLVGYSTNVVNDTTDWHAVRLSHTSKPFVINNDGNWFSFGRFSAYLLDTRVLTKNAKGETVTKCGFDPSRQKEAYQIDLDGLPYRINAWQPVNGLTNLTFTSTDVNYGYSVSNPDDDSEWGDKEYDKESGCYVGTTVSTASSLPVNCPVAAVKSVSIANVRTNDANVLMAEVAVTNLASYLDYNVAAYADRQDAVTNAALARKDFTTVEGGQSGSSAKDGVLTWHLPVPANLEDGFINTILKAVRQPVK